MANMRLTSSDSVVTAHQNTPGVATPVWEVRVPEKMKYTLYNGALLAMKLRQVGGQEIDPNDTIIIAGKRPGKGLPVELWRTTYRAWTGSERDQYDSTKNALNRLRLQGGGVQLNEEHRLYIMVESSKQVDPDQSFFEVEYEEARFRD
jgi:hypothetical protein